MDYFQGRFALFARENWHFHFFINLPFDSYLEHSRNIGGTYPEHPC